MKKYPVLKRFLPGLSELHNSTESMKSEVTVMNHRMRLLLALLFACLTQSLAQTSESKTVQERLGYPASARLLVIHADDLGMDHSVNRATLEALEQGWITSATILVPCPWFPEVARWAKQHPNADLALHLALTSECTDLRWAPVSGAARLPSLVHAHGYFPLDTPDVHQNPTLPDLEYQFR